MMSNAGLSHSALIIRTVTADPAQRLSAPPGTRHAYSNFGYCVLARCIEARDPQHRNYATHVQHEVLDRMGLAASDEFAFAMSEQAPVSKEASAYCTRPALPPGANAAPVEPAWIIADASAGPEPSIARMDAHGGWVALGSRPDSDRAHRTLRRDHEGGVARQPWLRARMVRQPGPQQRVAHWQPSGHERNDDIDRCARRFGLIRPCVFRCCAHFRICSPQLHVPPQAHCVRHGCASWSLCSAHGAPMLTGACDPLWRNHDRVCRQRSVRCRADEWAAGVGPLILRLRCCIGSLALGHPRND
jgi:hypothetical protein